MNTNEKNETQDKVTYQTPEIIDHGSLETTTQSSGSGITDGQLASGVPV